MKEWTSPRTKLTRRLVLLKITLHVTLFQSMFILYLIKKFEITPIIRKILVGSKWHYTHDKWFAYDYEPRHFKSGQVPFQASIYSLSSLRLFATSTVTSTWCNNLRINRIINRSGSTYYVSFGNDRAKDLVIRLASNC